MNQKIKELAERAGFNVWQDEDWNPGDVIDWSCRYDDELEKFFDLIVRECIWALWTEECRTSDLASEEYTRGSNKIKEHFGVRESMKYWTIVFPGECGQHIQETWSEKQILSSAWYKNWVMKVVQADRAYLIEDNKNAINDWCVVHWAVETNEFGQPVN